MWKNLLGLSGVILSLSTLVFALQPAEAKLGPTVSHGSNPVFSRSGYAPTISSGTIASVPGSEMVITDVVISAQYGETLELIINTDTGTEVGRFKTWNYSNYAGSGVIDSHLISGLRIPENEDLNFVNGKGTFTFSGYLGHP